MSNEEAVKYLIRPFASSTKPYNEYLKQKEAYDLAIKILEKRGTWVKNDEWSDWECPYCGHAFENRMNFCGYCGADMRGKEE